MTGFAKTIAVDSTKADIPNVGWTHLYRRGNLMLCDLDELVTNSGVAYIPEPGTVVFAVPKNGQHKGKTRRTIEASLVADVLREAAEQGDGGSKKALMDFTQEGLKHMGVTNAVLENGELTGFILKDHSFITVEEVMKRLGK
jgi:hypothetical protein